MGGDKDFNVPIVGGEQMYQALRSIGVPTRIGCLSWAIPRLHAAQFHTRPIRALSGVVRQVSEGACSHYDGEQIAVRPLLWLQPTTYYASWRMNGKSGEYEGRLVGTRRLDSLLGVRGNSAFYLTQNNGSSGDQLIELVLSDAASEATVSSWNRARAMSSDQLLRVHETGTADLDGTNVAYAVLDLPEDDLNEILTKRKLEEPEARSIFSAVASGLHAIHKRGFTHGAVTPPNIFLVQGGVRMSVDTLAPGGKRGEQRDLLQFSASLVKALTRCADKSVADAPAIAYAAAQLPAPFKQIAVGCAGGSSQGPWTAARIVETLTGRPPSGAQRPRVPWLALAGAGIGVVALLLYLFFHGSHPPEQVNQVAQQTPAAAAPPVRSQTPPAIAKPTIPKPSALDPRPAPATAGVADRNVTDRKILGSQSWAVIAGAYGHFDAAQKHAGMFHDQFPQLQVHVFPPEGQGRHYLIVLGSGLTQDAAERLRRNLIEQGAPSDTYVTKIAEN